VCPSSIPLPLQQIRSCLTTPHRHPTRRRSPHSIPTLDLPGLGILTIWHRRRRRRFPHRRNSSNHYLNNSSSNRRRRRYRRIPPTTVPLPFQLLSHLILIRTRGLHRRSIRSITQTTTGGIMSPNDIHPCRNTGSPHTHQLTRAFPGTLQGNPWSSRILGTRFFHSSVGLTRRVTVRRT